MHVFFACYLLNEEQYYLYEVKDLPDITKGRYTSSVFHNTRYVVILMICTYCLL